MELNRLLSLLALLAVLLAVLVIAVRAAARAATRALGGAARTSGMRALGGAARPPLAKNIVVDTLNLAHWLRANSSGAPSQKGPLTTAEITAAIERAAPALRRRFPGEIVFVLKDHNNTLNDGGVRAQYQAAAERARVRIVCAERYLPGAEPGTQTYSKNAKNAISHHSADGRDDFYMCLLARQLRCAVATEDRLRDFAEFRKEVKPFIVVTFAHWRALPARDFVRPDARAFAGLRRPRRIGFAELGITD